MEVINFDYHYGKPRRLNPVEVNIVLAGELGSWVIKYKGVELLQTNYQGVEGFNTFGYDEFFELNEKVLSHEILFASGSTILIHFRNVHIAKI